MRGIQYSTYCHNYAASCYTADLVLKQSPMHHMNEHAINAVNTLGLLCIVLTMFLNSRSY
jgi:hypothetical protein